MRSAAQLAGGLPQPPSVSYGFTSLDAGLAPRAQQSRSAGHRRGGTAVPTRQGEPSSYS